MVQRWEKRGSCDVGGSGVGVVSVCVRGPVLFNSIKEAVASNSLRDDNV